MHPHVFFFAFPHQLVTLEFLMGMCAPAGVETMQSEDMDGPPCFRVDHGEWGFLLAGVDTDTTRRIAANFASGLVDATSEVEACLARLGQAHFGYGMQISGQPDPETLRQTALGLAGGLDACFVDHVGFMKDGTGFYDAQGNLVVEFQEEEDEPDDDSVSLMIFSPRPQTVESSEIVEAFGGQAQVEVTYQAPGFFRFTLALPEPHDGDGTFDCTMVVMPEEELATNRTKAREALLTLAAGKEENLAPGLLDCLEASEQAWMVVGEAMAPGSLPANLLMSLSAGLADRLSGFVFAYGMAFSGQGSLIRPEGYPHDGNLREVWEPSERQRARNERVEALLASRRVPLYHGELYVDDDVDVTLRAPQDVARRVIALTAVAMRAEGMDFDKALAVLKNEHHDLSDELSPSEQAFFHDKDPTPEARQAMVWRYETIALLLWALGHLEELSWPVDMADMSWMMKFLGEHYRDPGFVNDATLRPKDEILDAQAVIVRLNWMFRESHINQETIPENLDWNAPGVMVLPHRHPGIGVVAERHYAVNWLVRLGDADWDDVTTPT